jgi:hyaluronoglucosaminidase
MKAPRTVGPLCGQGPSVVQRIWTLRTAQACAALCFLACGPQYPKGIALCTREPRYASLSPTGINVNSVCIDSSAIANFSGSAALTQAIADAGLHVSTGTEQCDWRVTLAFTAPTDLDRAALGVWNAGGEQEERFAAVSTLAQGMPTTTIYTQSARGAIYGGRAALATLTTGTDSASTNLFQSGTVVDYPGFTLRGVVESLYHKTYSLAELQGTLQVMSCLRENTYIYASKDDLYTHYQWAALYPADTAARLQKSAQAAADSSIDFVWAVSPGWWGGAAFIQASICYSCDADFARLIAKTESIRALGITRFALFLDDLASGLPYLEDQTQFTSLSQAHAFLINRWDDYLKSTGASQHLIVVGAKYTSDDTNQLAGTGWLAYNEDLGARIHPGISMIWTGPQVFAPTVQAADLLPIDQIYSQQIPQKVYLWNNWPKIVTALDGRAADLPTAASGFISCPVLNEFNKLPVSDFWKILGTSGDYAWRPDTYVPENSMARWSALLPRLAQ